MVAPISQLNPAAALEAASAAAAPASPLAGLQPGAVIAARVLALLENGQVQLAIGDALIEATAQVPLPLGATVQLAVQTTGNATTLQFLGQVDPQAIATGNVAPPGAPAVPPSAAQLAVPIAGPAASGAPNVSSAAPGIVPAASVNATAAVTNATQLAAPPQLVQTPAPHLVPSPAADPTVALQAAVRIAAATQGGLAPLFAEIAAAANLPTLPEPVQREALRLLSLCPPLDGDLAGEDIKLAFENSGLFLEAQLAETIQSSTGQATAAPAGAANGANAGAALAGTAPSGLPADDLKAALIIFRQVLETAFSAGEGAPAPLGAPIGPPLGSPFGPPLALPLGPGATAAALAATLALSRGQPTPAAPQATALAPHAAQPPPPFRGGPTSAQPPASASIDAATSPQDAIKTLMAATDGALSRQTLLQAASLPSPPPGQLSTHADNGGPRWNFEVPFATPQGTNVAQFEISRDGNAAKPVDGVGPVWRARFSVTIDPIGPVHAQIALRGTRAAVTLWAEQPEGAARLRAGAAKLTDALRAAELDAGDLVVRDGAPRARAMPAGHFLDRAS